MKRPGWVTVVGVLGIVFSGFGIMRSGRLLLLPWILKLQKEILELIARGVLSGRGGESVPEGMARILRLLFGNIPPWFGAWSVAAGVASMVVCAFYLYASISLLLMRPSACRLVYCAFGSSLALNVVKGVVFGATLSLIGAGVAIGSGFGAVLDGVLILVVLTSDKSAFGAERAAPAVRS